MELKHYAYNLVTGEVIACSRANALKRRVAWCNRWDKKFYPELRSAWRFSHNGKPSFKRA